MLLFERLNAAKRTLRRKTRPVSIKLFAMQVSPLPYQRENPRGQLAIDQVSIHDSDLRTIAFVSNVKVGWAVIVEVHRDHDSEEPADLWHLRAVRRRIRSMHSNVPGALKLHDNGPKHRARMQSIE